MKKTIWAACKFVGWKRAAIIVAGGSVVSRELRQLDVPWLLRAVVFLVLGITIGLVLVKVDRWNQQARKTEGQPRP